MEGIPPTVMRTASAVTAPSGPTAEAIRVTSWLPMKVLGVNEERKALWRCSAQSSSKRFRSLIEDQTAFHNSYWVTVSTPAAAVKPA